MNERALRPTALPERADAIDALRGACLFGVLLVNALTHFRVSAFERYLPAAERTPLDAFLTSAVAIALEAQAYVLLSLLFGVGLAAQHERARDAGRSFALLAARRLASLFVLGALHMVLIWDGDILALYAIAGLVVAPLFALGSRALLIAAVLFFVVAVLPLPYPTAFPSVDAMAAHVEQARHVYAHGSYGAVLAFRSREVVPLTMISLWSLPRTIALYALGAWAWGSRARAKQLSSGRLAALAIGLVVGGGVALASIGRARSEVGVAMLSGWGSVVLALGVGVAFLAVYDRTPAGRVLAALVPLGRMALTAYLMQSMLLGFVFYGYGCGQFGRLGVVEVGAIVVGIYTAQVALSAVWLRWFRFGPMEWAWRSIVYAAALPLRRAG
jgi:uncharacterized protein